VKRKIKHLNNEVIASLVIHRQSRVVWINEQWWCSDRISPTNTSV